MASKYDALRDAMGGKEDYRDAAKNGGFIFKWYADTRGATLEERKVNAIRVAERLKHLPYVRKVNIRNATWQHMEFGGNVISGEDQDKICVYIDRI